MASVYRAHQPSVNRSVALKIITLDASLGERDEFRSRFALEAQMIAALEHIHILPIYDYGIVNNEIAYIAMRLLRGGTLADLLVDGPLEHRPRRRRFHAARARAELRPQQRRHPPRPQAEQHHVRRRRQRVPDRLRLGEDGRKLGEHHQNGQYRRHARLHVAGAAARRRARLPLRHLQRWAASSITCWSGIRPSRRPSPTWSR